MARLAIQGHVTRGSEVIALLEMLGGKNIFNLTGTKEIWYILSNGTIKHSAYLSDEKRFTLEEFLEKFPYKVGDKVTLDKFPCTIKGMSWDCDDVIYYVQGVDFSKGIYSKDKDLQPYKEETMEEKLGQIIFDMPDGYEFFGINDDNKIVLTKKQPKYPKTYKDCCEVLALKTMDNDAQGYKAYLIIRFQELLIARDAYWKIAGEQMGLDKPWEPDYNEESYEQGSPIKYVIYYTGTYITKGVKCTPSHILAFPIEEMRDAFYENFKELIEICKELL